MMNDFEVVPSKVFYHESYIFIYKNVYINFIAHVAFL
jgi:hypothetical protein